MVTLFMSLPTNSISSTVNYNNMLLLLYTTSILIGFILFLSNLYTTFSIRIIGRKHLSDNIPISKEELDVKFEDIANDTKNENENDTTNFKVPFFYHPPFHQILSSYNNQKKYPNSFHNHQPPFLDLIKCVNQYQQSVDSMIQSMVKEYELAKRAEYIIMETSTSSSLSGRNTLLSTVLEERIAQSAQLCEADAFILQSLLQPFSVTLGLSQEESHYDDETSNIMLFFHHQGETKQQQETKKSETSTMMDSSSTSSSSYDSIMQVITHIVRDWSYLGSTIRISLYQWCIDKLNMYSSQQSSSSNTPIVLVPGSGLGRLAYEIYKSGYNVEANELSIVMSSVAYHILHWEQRMKVWKGNNRNEYEKMDNHYKQNLNHDLPHFNNHQEIIHPFMIDFAMNEVNASNRYQPIPFPDIIPNNNHEYNNKNSDDTDDKQYTDKKQTFRHFNDNTYEKESKVNESMMNGYLSYTVGDFIEIYSTKYKKGKYTSIVTCFFIDTASNIYEYIVVIKNLLSKNNGLWINVGPLQWHYNSKIHLSGDELYTLIENFGFKILEWSVDDEPLNYRHDDGLDDDIRYTKYEGYKPLRFVAVLNTLTDDDSDAWEKVMSIRHLNKFTSKKSFTTTPISGDTFTTFDFDTSDSTLDNNYDNEPDSYPIIEELPD